MLEEKTNIDEKGLTHEQMIEMLQSNGLNIPDIPFAIEVLKSINFHKFVNSYGKKYFIDDSEQFVAGTCFEDIYHLYIFDISMSGLLERNLRFSEVKTLSILVDHYCINYGVFSHADSNNFLQRDTHQQNLKAWSKSCKTNLAKVPFYRLYNYVSFGFVDKIVYLAKYDDKKTICRNLSIKPKYYKFLDAWIKHLNKVRNTCAHNGRIYDSVFSIFKLPNSLPENYQEYRSGVFGCVIIMSLILDKAVFAQLILDIKRLESRYAQFKLKLSIFGFPKKWEKVIEDIRNEISL